jgi:hypothetical protein
VSGLQKPPEMDGKTTMIVRTVTPADAARWIRHSHQRQIDLLKVRMMLNDIEAGVWQPEGHTPIIVLDGRGCIADGHHRLIATLIHGHPVEHMTQHK